MIKTAMVVGGIIATLALASQFRSPDPGTAREADVLPSLPCQLDHNWAETFRALSPVKKLDFLITTNAKEQLDDLIRTNNEEIADIMDDPTHLGWDATGRRMGFNPEPHPEWDNRVAKPGVRTLTLCTAAYEIRELRTEIALARSPDDQQVRQMAQEIADDNRRVGIANETLAQRIRDDAMEAAAAGTAAVENDVCSSAGCASGWQRAAVDALWSRFRADLAAAQRVYCATETDPDLQSAHCRAKKP